MSDSGPISTPSGRPGDETISAFVDGQIESAAERERIAELARSDPEVQARIAAYQTQKRAIRAAFDGTLQEPLPLHLLRRRRAPPSTQAWRAAAAIALFIAGAGVGANLMPRLEPAPATVVAMNGQPASVTASDELRSSLSAGQADTKSQMEEAAAKTSKDTNAVTETAAVSATGNLQSRSDQGAALASASVDFLEQALAAYGSASDLADTATSTATTADDARRDKTADLDAASRAAASVDLTSKGFHLAVPGLVMGGAGAPAGAPGGGPNVFVDNTGRRVMLFAAPATLPGRGFQWGERGPLRVVAWTASSGSFALVGPLSRDEMLALARLVVAQTFN